MYHDNWIEKYLIYIIYYIVRDRDKLYIHMWRILCNTLSLNTLRTCNFRVTGIWERAPLSDSKCTNVRDRDRDREIERERPTDMDVLPSSRTAASGGTGGAEGRSVHNDRSIVAGSSCELVFHRTLRVTRVVTLAGIRVAQCRRLASFFQCSSVSGGAWCRKGHLLNGQSDLSFRLSLALRRSLSPSPIKFMV